MLPLCHSVLSSYICGILLPTVNLTEKLDMSYFAFELSFRLNVKRYLNISVAAIELMRNITH